MELSTILAFFDFETAFDMIHREAIWDTLYNLGYIVIPSVKFDLETKKKFVMSRGVRQGCVLSPVLFLLVLDSVMVHTNKEAPDGIQWRLNQRLNDLDYADEICHILSPE
jgi:Reverse transcriptase (RNA-dependent DNA polymerase)